MSAETELGQRAIDVISGVLRTATTHDTANDAVQRLLGDLRLPGSPAHRSPSRRSPAAR